MSFENRRDPEALLRQIESAEQQIARIRTDFAGKHLEFK